MALLGIYSLIPQFKPQICFNPSSYTDDIFDVKLLWIIHEFFKNNTDVYSKYQELDKSMSMETTTMTSEKITKDRKYNYKLMNDMCYQLELLGLWKYSIYIVLVTSTGTFNHIGCWLVMINI